MARKRINFKLIAKRAGIGLGGLLLVAAALYWWPTYIPNLAHATKPADVTYAQAAAQANSRVVADTADSNVLPECRSQFLPQPQPTAKVVLLLHGYTACPGQFAPMAQALFKQGYTVYVPRAPKHGLANYQKLIVAPAADLVTYANTSATIAKGLGTDVGVIGMSGGGVLTAWLAHNRPDAVKHVEILDPFFSISPSQASKAQVRLLIDLWGLSHLIKDVPQGPNGSYTGIAQYLLIARNIPNTPKAGVSAALVLAPGDTATDLKLSSDRFKKMFPGSPRYTSPTEWNFTHDNVSAKELGSHALDAYLDYIRAYEQKSVQYLDAQ